MGSSQRLEARVEHRTASAQSVCKLEFGGSRRQRDTSLPTAKERLEHPFKYALAPACKLQRARRGRAWHGRVACAGPCSGEQIDVPAGCKLPRSQGWPRTVQSWSWGRPALHGGASGGGLRVTK